MPVKSAITWTETTWSPVIGCTKVSEGCRHCYAKREVDTRWSKNPKSIWFGRDFGDVLCQPDQLEAPLHWKKPRRIFVCPRADLFHDDVPDAFIDQVFSVMALAPQHTFQVLTKRPARMRAYLSDVNRRLSVQESGAPTPAQCCSPLIGEWPLPNVWIGVSVENQAAADERIPLLLQTPAAVRWISAEPLLGPVNLDAVKHSQGYGASPCAGCGADVFINALEGSTHCDGGCDGPYMPTLDWVVVGGESGPLARPMHPQWARDLRSRCAYTGTPFLFKQWGEYAPKVWTPYGIWDLESSVMADVQAGRALGPAEVRMIHVGKKYAGRLLDGVLHDGYPEVRS